MTLLQQSMTDSVTAAWTPLIPHFDPVEPTTFRKKRLEARKILDGLQPPSDKKYTNWERLKLAERFADKDIGGIAPELVIDQPDYDTGLKTIAIPLSKAVKDWPEHVEPYLAGEALPPDYNFMSAFSAATYTDGAVVVIPDNTTVDVTATFAAQPGKLNSYRTIIIVGEGAKATFTELTAPHTPRNPNGESADTTITHGVEVYAKPNSRFSYYGLQEWTDDVSYWPVYRAIVERDATLDWLIGSFGAKLSQLQVESALSGPGATSAVRAVYYGSADQHFDQQLVANHVVGHTTSDTYARGVVDERAKAVYRGLIKIQRGAHGSSADQNGHAMLMTSDAHADAIPGLEIDADDVTAGHGATVGKVDEEQLFYLMARGLSREQAVEMLVRGFFEDLFKRITRADVRERFWNAVDSKRNA